MKPRKPASAGKEAPSPTLLSLVGSFLVEHGLDSTNKTLLKELKTKQASEDWQLDQKQDEISSAISLEQLLQTWREKHMTSPSDSSDSDDESSTDSSSADNANQRGSMSTTSSENEESDISSATSSEEEESDDGGGGGGDDKNYQLELSKKPKLQRRLSTSTNSSTDSETSYEKEKPSKLKVSGFTKKVPPPNTGVRQKLKRKAESVSSDSSQSESESSDDGQPAKRTKTNHISEGETSSEDSSNKSSTSESSEAESESEAEDDTSLLESNDSEMSSPEEEDNRDISTVSVKEQVSTFIKAASDSSGTIVGDKPTNLSASESESDSKTSQEGEVTITEVKVPVALVKKHAGAKPTPLAELSAQVTANSHISNAYQSYDYADRAYQDLSVTRGRDFTKEKNKKKRGSYRGGAIDISGGKGFKFED